MSSHNRGEKQTKRDEQRLERDNKTVVAMAQLYCHDHHHGLQGENGLCSECSEVVDILRNEHDVAPIFIKEFVRHAKFNVISLK